MSTVRDSEPAPDDGAAPSAPAATSGLVFGDPLDRPSSDDTDRGWGDSFPGAGDEDFTRFLNEKPPHHL
jgi:acetyl-CoA synthetase